MPQLPVGQGRSESVDVTAMPEHTGQAPDNRDPSSREEVPIFGTEENRAKLMAIYDEALRQWPVPFETFFVATRYGKTHVIASGDPASPPLVLTHPAAVGGFVWSSIIAPLSEKRRVYALDTIGDFGRSELADPDGTRRRAATTAPGSTTCTQTSRSHARTSSQDRWAAGSR
jgi:hypothetical protein